MVHIAFEMVQLTILSKRIVMTVFLWIVYLSFFVYGGCSFFPLLATIFHLILFLLLLFFLTLSSLLPSCFTVSDSIIYSFSVSVFVLCLRFRPPSLFGRELSRLLQFFRHSFIRVPLHVTCMNLLFYLVHIPVVTKQKFLVVFEMTKICNMC